MYVHVHVHVHGCYMYIYNVLVHVVYAEITSYTFDVTTCVITCRLSRMTRSDFTWLRTDFAYES